MDENSFQFFQLKTPNNGEHRERSREKDNGKNKNYSHQRTFKRDLCKYYLNGVCTKGDNCTYSHIIKNFPCKYYVTLGSCDNKECR